MDNLTDAQVIEQLKVEAYPIETYKLFRDYLDKRHEMEDYEKKCFIRYFEHLVTPRILFRGDIDPLDDVKGTPPSQEYYKRAMAQEEEISKVSLKEYEEDHKANIYDWNDRISSLERGYPLMNEFLTSGEESYKEFLMNNKNTPITNEKTGKDYTINALIANSSEEEVFKGFSAPISSEDPPYNLIPISKAEIYFYIKCQGGKHSWRVANINGNVGVLNTSVRALYSNTFSSREECLKHLTEFISVNKIETYDIK